MNSSPTPRTDAEPPVYEGFPSTVSREFARQLERELNAATLSAVAPQTTVCPENMQPCDMGCSGGWCVTLHGSYGSALAVAEKITTTDGPCTPEKIEAATRSTAATSEPILGVNAWMTAKAVEGMLLQHQDEDGTLTRAMPFTLFEWRDILTALQAATRSATRTCPGNHATLDVKYCGTCGGLVPCCGGPIVCDGCPNPPDRGVSDG